MQNILLIRLKAIGDVVLTLPAVHAVRENFPSAKISFLTSKENAPLMQGFRDVDETLCVDRAALRGGNPLKMTKEISSLLKKLRGGKFSLTVDFQANGESGWLTRFTGAPERWGFAKKTTRRWAYTHWSGHHLQLHPAESNGELLRGGGLKIGALKNEFFLPADALAAAREFFSAHNFLPEKTTLFIQPFTSGAHKNWPLENFVAVARHLRGRGAQIIFGGGPGDRAALEPAAREGFVIAAGVPLLVSGGLMQLSTLVLGGDTGALHLAVALGKKVLMLMYRADAGSPTPFNHPEFVLEAPRRALAEIPVADVTVRCEAVLG